MIRHSDPGSMLASLVLAAIVLLGPLPFGSVMPRERSALQVAAFLALALALFSRRGSENLGHVRWPLFGLVAIALLGAAQSSLWPEPLARWLAPGVTEQWVEAHQLLDEVDGADAPAAGAERSRPDFVSLSVAPPVSRLVALHWLAVAAALAAGALQARERGARRLVSLALMATVVFQILFGADHWIRRESTLWGVDVPGDPSRLRGTFVNADHFAMLLAMAVTASVAWLWWALRKSLRQRKEGVEHQVIRISLPVLAFGLFFVGLTFTGSRAGLVAVVLALLGQGLLLSVRYRRWQWGLAAIGLVGLGAAVVGLFGWRRGLGRWLETSAYEISWSSRFQVWREAMELWTSSPLFGSGLGTFRQAFPRVQPPTLPGTWHHAHNDYLELLVTAGPLALAVAGLGIAATLARLWRVFRRGRRSEDRGAALAVLGAILAVGAHSLVDFGLTMPSNAFTLAVFVGLTAGARLLEGGRRQRRTVFLEEGRRSHEQGSNEDGARASRAPRAEG